VPPAGAPLRVADVLYDAFAIVGTTLADKYDVDELVAEGGFGLVYRATHRIWRQPVALKCFKVLAHVPAAQRTALMEEFIREGALLTELSRRSASIVQARDVGNFTAPDGTWVPYLVLEWLDGRSLEQILDSDRRRLTVASAMRLLEPVARALDIVHRKGIAHRDIKPANIFVLGELYTEDMFVKVLDFGIAKVMQAAGGQFAHTAGALTSFTPLYGAPEQFSRTYGATGPWTDVFALALVFCELLAGTPALLGVDFIQMGMSCARPDERPTPRTRGVEIRDDLEAVFARALAVRPEERFQTAGEFWNAVRAAAELPPLSRLIVSGAPMSVPSSVVRSPENPRLSGEAQAATVIVPALRAQASRAAGARRGVVLAVAVLFAGALGAAVWMRSRPLGSSPPPSASRAAAVPLTVSAPSAPPPAPPCPDDMVSIAGGKFFMGADDGKDEEKPAHQVTLSPFCMDRREVTTADYEACSSVGECQRAPIEVDWKGITPREVKIYSALCNATKPERGAHPVNCVDFERAVQYCSHIDKRLPTEAEWEFAARGSDGRKYPWGDEEPDATRLNACGKECIEWGAKNGVPMRALYAADDGFVGTAPVGSFPKGASPFGLVDIVGNVWEWTSDWDGKYTKEAEIDPRGPPAGTYRIVRGGAFNGAFASWIRPTQRYSDRPETHSHAYGFRCAKSRSRT
jgi:formylglycine-generating enzyme required for sulfatase activity/serine/threonine protein kinase